ncbi:chloride channel protein B-like isoform X2 [Sycon ciliatum]|uniref:chloride channel protein B-like isoform X2 n=1 Tax=Sycon ciliatum TaxID=27933 RepID=UPI0031F68FDA
MSNHEEREKELIKPTVMLDTEGAVPISRGYTWDGGEIPKPMHVPNPAARAIGAVPRFVAHMFRKLKNHLRASEFHRYSLEERERLSEFESFDYLPPHSTAYKIWSTENRSKDEWEVWLMMALIGTTTGLVAFLLIQLIDIISETKWHAVIPMVERNDLALGWVTVMWISLCCVSLSTALVVLFRPSAAGSGIPELIGFLNGTFVHHIFNIKTMIAKFLSCALAVSAGLPAGPEGPVIHMGALIGAGLSQTTFGLRLKHFSRFRNSQDRRDFISAGAGAGVAAAFGSPVGGLLFVMEEVSSFWNIKLGLQTFFCCMVSSFVSGLFNSAITDFSITTTFGQFRSERVIPFYVADRLAINFLLFLPAIILGCLGGLLGGLFTHFNIQASKLRNHIRRSIKGTWKVRLVRMADPVIITLIVGTIFFFLPHFFECKAFQCQPPMSGFVCDNTTCTANSSDVIFTCEQEKPLNPLINMVEENRLVHFNCPRGVKKEYMLTDGTRRNYSNDTYNEAATLLYTTGEAAVKRLLSRGTHLQFSEKPLVGILILYSFFACITAGSAISTGLVIPMLFIGSIYGRLFAYGLVRWFGVHDRDSYWGWIDPGAISFLGAASFFGGVSRLSMALTVIMIEITGDVEFLLPIMVTVLISKWVGDYLTHPLYHALMEIKCIPFLDTEPVIYKEHHGQDDGERGIADSLELYQARHAMSSPAVVLGLQETVNRLANTLLSTKHGGFPVVRDVVGVERYSGLVSRETIHHLLNQGEPFFLKETDLDKLRDYDKFIVDEPSDVGLPFELLGYVGFKSYLLDEQTIRTYAEDPKFNDRYIDLSPYINQSQPTVPTSFSLKRTYIIFRTLGLRHLPVVDVLNRVVGIITRKDLMGFSLEEKVSMLRKAIIRKASCRRTTRTPTTSTVAVHNSATATTSLGSTSQGALSRDKERTNTLAIPSTDWQ